MMNFFKFLILVLLVSANSAAFAASGITYQGRLLKPDGTPVLATNVQFRLQIRTPGVEDCLVYEELQSHDLSNTKGSFALSIGDTSGVRQDTHHTWTLFDSLSNRKDFSFTAGDCVGINSYSPDPADNRTFRVFFNDGTFAGWEALPIQVINYVPMSVETYAVGGFPASSLLRVETAGALGTASPMTATQYGELMALIGGSSAQYSRPNQLNGSTLPAIGSGQSVRWTGSAWEAYTPPTNASLPTCTAGQVLTSNGSALSCVADGGGAGAIDGDDITSGTIGGTTAWNTSGNITTTGNIQATGTITATGAITGGSFSGSVVSTRDLLVYDSTNTNYVSIQAPGGLTPNYTLTLPANDGDSGDVLSTNGSGVLSWTAPASGGSGGNVDLSNIRSTVNPLNQVFPSTPCTTAQTLRYHALSDTYQCSDVEVASTGLPDDVILNGGNTVSSAMTLGTNSNHDLGFETNGSTKMTILSDGKVGVGTTNPLDEFHIYSPTDDSGIIIQSGNATGGDAAIGLWSTTSGGTINYTWMNSDQLGNLLYHPFSGEHHFHNTSSVNSMTILNSGNVGIGTDAPSAKLDVNGAAQINGWLTIMNGFGSYQNEATAYNSTSSSSDQPTGTAIEIINTNSNNNTMSYYTFRANNSSGNGQKAYMGVVSNSGAGVYTPTFVIGQKTGDTAYEERLRIDQNGNLGIGTTSANAKLTVEGATSLRQLALDPVGAANYGSLYTKTDGKLYYRNGTGTITDLTAGGGGGGSGDVLNGGNTGAVTLGSNDANNLTLETGDSPRVTILSGGNVGIGTTNPSATLHVAGTGIRSTGEVNEAPQGMDRAEIGVQNGLPRLILESTTFANPWQIANDVGELALFTHAAGGSFGIYVNGNTRMLIDASGNVGIGTGTPGRLLHVNGPMRVTASALPVTPGLGDIAIDSGDGNKLKWYNGLTWQSAGGAAGGGDILNGGNSTGAELVVGTNDTQNLSFETSGTKRMTIGATGTVELNGSVLSGGTGQGTSTPGSFTVAGSSAAGTNVTGGNLILQAGNGTGTGASGIIQLITGSSGTGAAVALDSAINQACLNCTSFSANFTVAANSNRVLIVTVPFGYTNSNLTAITFNGQALTKLGDATVTTVGKLEVWYLKEPPTGTHTLSISFDVSNYGPVGIASFYNVDQTAPFGTPVVYTSASATTSSLTVPSVTAEAMVFRTYVNQSNCGGHTASGTSRWSSAIGGPQAYWGVTTQTGTGNVSVTRTCSSAGYSIQYAFMIKPFSGISLSPRVHVAANGRVGIGTTSPGYQLDVVGDIQASGCLRSNTGIASGNCTSDMRLKKDIQNFDLGLDALMGIKPHYYKYNGLGGNPESAQPELGVIAQEVEETAPELIVKKRVLLHPTDREPTEIKQVNYTAIMYVLVNAVKEVYELWRSDSEDLRAELKAAQEKARLLEAENREIKERLLRIENKLNSH